MGKSSLSPQSRKVLYGIIGIALFIGAVLIIASVGQQLGTIFDNANAQNENGTLSPSSKRINPLIPDVLGSHEADEDGNLLTNPGFEDPYITFPGEPDMLVADGWTPWHFPQTEDMPSYSNLQPEYYGAYPDETRIRSGDNAQVISSIFATHDGGVYQTVSGLTPNQELLFSVYAYVWSNDFDSEESRQISTNPGGITIQVGIDPFGGIDLDSENIIWSEPVEQYDEYRQYAISALPIGNTVTVWVRSQITSPQSYNFIYLDDASLIFSINQ
ncbi:MAG TPA: hypothetical protein PLZ51_25195, partial [Aggregatilineales bacterium]|nr:hypothetical protein [Aggregatilineales bacterium]